MSELYDPFKELKDASRHLWAEILVGLRIDKFVSWLARKLER